MESWVVYLRVKAPPDTQVCEDGTIVVTVDVPEVRYTTRRAWYREMRKRAKRIALRRCKLKVEHAG